ncbi:glycosyltransferase family 25 protein [Roseobacter sp.]|uniref:glycosyltransferase family 25 protein n=1 Tax=Roseobacter sp. TaxID=1907202 RepID=UPI0032969DC0
MTDVKAYIIHLQSATQRKENIDLMRTKLPRASVVEAIDATTLDASTQRLHYKRFASWPPYPFAMRTSEIACFLSHRKCWQIIADGDAPYALVLEDDVAFVPSVFDRALAKAEEMAAETCFIRLERCKNDPDETIQPHIIKPKFAGHGMQTQLVGRETAKHLLRVTEVFDRPVDTILQMPWLSKQTLMEVVPSGIKEISDALGGSTIATRKSRYPRIYRELLRPAYRAAVIATTLVLR